MVPCRSWTGTLKNPTKWLWRWEPDRRFNYFFFNPPAHLCAVTYITEISLHVTLNNQYQYQTALGMPIWKKICGYGGVTAFSKKGGYHDPARMGCFYSMKKGGLYNSEKYGLKGMQHKMQTTCMWPPPPQNRNYIATSSFYRQCSIHYLIWLTINDRSINTSANEGLHSNLR